MVKIILDLYKLFKIEIDGAEENVIIKMKVKESQSLIRGDDMARLSDLIENFIKQMLETSEQSVLEIQRNELANIFNCAPSQINYVLTTRFTVNRGYYIESRRGGGGCIKITRMEPNEDDYIKSVIWNNIGNQVSQQEGEEYVSVFKSRGIITDREAMLIRCAISDKVLLLPEDVRRSIRAQILKTMLINILD